MENNTDIPTISSLLVEGRDCGECKACCEALSIDSYNLDGELSTANDGRVDLVKGEGPLCKHWQDGACCTVYDKRPIQCETFYCMWMVTDSWPEEYRPDRMGIIWTSQRQSGKHPYIGADTYNAPFDVFDKPEVRKIIELLVPHIAVIIRHDGRRFLINPYKPFPTEEDLHVQ